MKKLIVSLFIFLIAGSVSAQGSDVKAKNLGYLGFGRQGVLYLKYERLLFGNDWTESIINIGLGGVPGELDYGVARTNKIMPEFAQLFGYKKVFIEVGLEASINFHGKISYIDVNGILGLRYQSRISDFYDLFCQIGYNPKLYYTYENDIDIPIYLGLGLSF